MILTSLLLGSLLASQGGTPDTSLASRSFRFTYSASVTEVPAGAEQVRLWIPIPLDNADQEIDRIRFTAKTTDGQTNAAGFGAKPDNLRDGSQGGLTWSFHDVQGGFGRSVCIESMGSGVEAELTFDVKRYETKGGGSATQKELAKLMQPENMIPLDGKVSAVAATLKLPPDPLETARALYDHTLERMKYDKPAGEAWGRGDAEWACDSKFGNCTDFHSYFMGLARTKGMAARFEMGFPIPAGDQEEAEVGGYHCWAYVWIEGHGWMPVDISEADKNPDKTEYFFGTLDPNRFTMTGGRNLTLTPTPAAGTLNFFVYPYAEVDGEVVQANKAFKRVNL